MRNLLCKGSINLPCEAQPDTGLLTSERLPVLATRCAASLLQNAALTSLLRSYRVKFFEKPIDLFVARAAPFSYALLCASAGCSLLAAEAYIVRKQWPFAKIILLGPAPHDLQDHLYDDTVAADCSAATLATALSNRSMDLWHQTIGWNTGKSELRRAHEESDPTKTGPLDLLPPSGAELRDLPAQEKQDMCRAVASRPSCLLTNVRPDSLFRCGRRDQQLPGGPGFVSLLVDEGSAH
jgi:hypothetical protein